jgi:trans-aconitate methyltransferase
VTLGQEYFDRLYQHHSDPWKFRTRWYEARKLQMTMAALPDEHYPSVFEPGCSIGLLTRLLAARSDRVLAMDTSAAALRQAQTSVPDHVQLRKGTVPDDWPSGHFDLVVLSELGYYLDEKDCQQLATRAVTSAADLIAVHWRHPVEDYPLTGDHVHRIMDQTTAAHGLIRICHHVETDFRLAVWSHDHRSVASRTGLIPT